MQKKYYILLALIIIVSSLTILEYSQGTVSSIIFDQMNYNYGSNVLIPPNQANGTYLGGYYKINGTGHNFNMILNLTGAENSESPLDYTANGLHITGTIDNIKITPGTIIALTQANFKQALFNTIFTGNMTMKCGAWTGTSKFQNNGKNFTGTFQIPGPLTYWAGTYTLTQGQNNILLSANYLLYPENAPQNIRQVHEEYYL
jgi:hypothetical protein